MNHEAYIVTGLSIELRPPFSQSARQASTPVSTSTNRQRIGDGIKDGIGDGDGDGDGHCMWHPDSKYTIVQSSVWASMKGLSAALLIIRSAKSVSSIIETEKSISSFIRDTETVIMMSKVSMY